MDTENLTTNPQEIDIFALLEGTEYPERVVTVYTNPKAADDYTKLAKSEKVDKAALEVATTKLQDTSLVFTIRGIEPGLVQDIYAEDGEGEDVNKENTLIAKSIVSVKTGNGSTVTTVWDADSVGKLRRKLPLSEITKLIGEVVEVNFDSALFDNAVDAGFPG